MQVNKVKVISTFVALSTAIVVLVILATSPKQPLLSNTNRVVAVKILKAEPQEFTPLYKAYGRIETSKTLNLYAQVEGEIISINENFEVGNQVNKSEVIYRIDEQRYQNQMQARLGELKVAEANLQLELGQQSFSESEYQRVKPSQVGPKKELQESLMLRKPQLEIAEANVLIAASNLEIAKKNLLQSKYQLQEDYIVLGKNAFKGEFVQKGDLIGSLASLSGLRVNLSLPSDIVSVLSVGQKVEVYRDNKISVGAYISQVPPILAPSSQLQNVYLAVENENKSLILNEFVTVNLTLPSYKNVLKVPMSSIDEDKIWLVDKSMRLLSKRIQVVWKNENSIVIKNVLEKGMYIVENKIYGAKDGMTATITNGELK